MSPAAHPPQPPETPTPRPLSPARCLAASIGLLLLAGAAFFLLVALRESRAFDRALREPVAVFEADLSRPGVYKATVREWYPAAHAENLRIELASGAPAPHLWALRGSFEILDAEGKVRDTVDLPGARPAGWSGPRAHVVRFTPPGSGWYTYALTVTHPEPALAGVPHRVVAEYELCGCERLMSLFSRWIGVSLAFVGGFATLIAFTAGRLREGGPPPQEVSSPP